MKDIISRVVDRLEPQLTAISRDLWENPEPAWTERHASEVLKGFLKENGFEIEPVPGLPTAFIGRWGSGRPIIGLLAEYDGLPGFSQKTCTHEEPVAEGAPGHACGHNLMGAAHVGAAVAVKEALEESGLPGTILMYGTPAEEVLTGKVFMARTGVFDPDKVDCTLNFHPDSINGVNMHRLAAINNVKFNFYGTVSHAAARPHEGRSASDAAELMNVGANYLREHIPEGVRIHYVTTDGGKAPNIVANRAQTWYYVRAKRRDVVDEVYKRLVKVAEGAAHMTETEVKVDLQGGCYPTMQNKVLALAIDESMREIGAPKFTEEEKAYAAELEATCPANPPRAYPMPPVPLSEDIVGLFDEGGFAYNAADMGDVMHLVPSTMFSTVCYNLRADLHSWQVAACTGHSIGFKGMLFAAKVLALTSMKIYAEPERLAQAQAEFKEKMGDQVYICPIPAEINPPV